MQGVHSLRSNAILTGQTADLSFGLENEPGWFVRVETNVGHWLAVLLFASVMNCIGMKSASIPLIG